MAEKRDYYEVLGVDKSATESEIKSAFRKQAKTCHPDLHPGDKEAEAKFKEINEAAEVLSDPDKRAKYDQFGHAAFDPTAGGAGGGYSPFGGGFGGFSDIFETMFGGGFSSGSQRTGPLQGDDLRYTLTVNFEDAAFGVKREIVIPREDNCATCGGTGAKPGTSPTRCPTCVALARYVPSKTPCLAPFPLCGPVRPVEAPARSSKSPAWIAREAAVSRKQAAL